MNSSITIERKRSDCSALPKGWQREEVLKKSGISAGKVDVYYYSPTGNRIDSKPQLARYLGDTYDISSFDFQNGKIVPQPPPPPTLTNLYRNNNIQNNNNNNTVGNINYGHIGGIVSSINNNSGIGCTIVAQQSQSVIAKRKYKAQFGGNNCTRVNSIGYNINNQSSSNRIINIGQGSTHLRHQLEFRYSGCSCSNLKIKSLLLFCTAEYFVFFSA